VNKRILFILLILSVFIIASCKSTPEEVVEEELVEEAVPEAVPEVSKEELLLARQALQRAEEAEASRFAPDLMRGAYAELKEAANLAESDPDKSRELLASVKEKADRGYELGIEGLIAEGLSSMDKLDQSLLDIEADKFSPETYAAVRNQFDDTRKLIDEGKLIEAKESYYLSSMKAKNLHRQLSENIRWVGILERDTEIYLSDAESEEAYLWADIEFVEASDLLSLGMTSFRQYDLKGSEAQLKEAKFKARNVLYLARTRKKQAETDQMLQSIQKELEEVSTLMVQDEEGVILEGDPWSGSEFLNENPLLNVEAENYEEEESSLLDYNLTKPLNEDVEIVEEEEEELAVQDRGVSSLLEKAKALWQEGVKARNDGDYKRSKELFVQAEAYIKAYRNNAVGKTYTVQYKPEDRDCLWKISAFEDMYGDPFLWPRIWKRNQKSIPNPDLIYPGQVLIIPPLEN